MRPELVRYAILSVAFVLSRVALYAAGLRFKLELTWMFMSDIGALKERPLETIFYFHAFGPGMDMLTALLLALVPEAHLGTAAALVFMLSGWLLCVSLYELGKRVGLREPVAMGLGLGFTLLPQSLFFENLYLYTYPCAALSCLAAVLFESGLRRGCARRWAGFFACCSVLGLLYTTFHLAWALLLGSIAFVLSRPGTRRQVLYGAPALLLLVALYGKNLAVFGVFGATSWGGANMTLITTARMPAALRDQWIREGKLSPFAAINVYSGPEAYRRYFPADRRYPWPTTNELTRPTLSVPNFNHGSFLEVNQRRRKDAAYFIEAMPGEYLRRVWQQNLPALFDSTTHWHPHDRKPSSPHFAHRQVLGGYERLYDRLVHSWPERGPGLYWFLPLLLIWAGYRCLKDLWSGPVPAELRSQAVVIGFCLFQISYIVTASSLFTAFESSRYRYSAEPFIWVLAARALSALWGFARERSRRRAEAPGAAPA